MHYSTILIALAASVASAAPTGATTAAKDQELIQLWQDQKFLGLKFTGSGVVDKCFNLPGDFTNNVSSAKAKPGFRCTIWVKKDCKDTGFSFDEAGNKVLPDWIDNKSKSWKCNNA
ncbi:hypothetical protein BT63DRAFT_444081 [Microthyrium microscopicum]|uniref:Beta/gamma crystallin 'Greek key' domain-containing protein n=1 Tax=Microthyrium microscopicum TaxID=703497 RepID=A0A6A6TX02_9PEZI|nr:hypothetical protein BT63DRAFT_444081 [Microthyrium microscopicum]